MQRKFQHVPSSPRCEVALPECPQVEIQTELWVDAVLSLAKVRVPGTVPENTDFWGGDNGETVKSPELLLLAEGPHLRTTPFRAGT